MRSLFHLIGLGAVVLVASLPAGASTHARPIHFRAYAETGLALVDVVWTGKEFLYVENTTNDVFAAGPTGTPIRRFASMPDIVEETRCRLSPASHGFAAGDIYCLSPDNIVYRLSADGQSVSVFARLGDSEASDGALAFDTVGHFGFELLAATGRSGSATQDGGTVYAVNANGGVRRIGRYPGPGGADQIAIAPRRFGTATGHVLLTVDAGPFGTLQAMDATGNARTLVELDDGPNPIVAVPYGEPRRRKGVPPSGLYVTDTASRTVFFASASQFARFRGHVIVGSEPKALFWVIRPSQGTFVAVPLATNLAGARNLEGATYIR